MANRKSRQSLIRHATEWYMEISAPQATDQTVASWQAWLAESDAHQQAFDEVHELMQLSSQVEDTMWPDQQELLEDDYDGSVPYADWKENQSGRESHLPDRGWGWFRRRKTARNWMWGSVALAGLAAIAVLVTGYMQPQVPPELVYQTAVAEHLEVPLDDGSVMTLGGKSRVLVHYNKRQRGLRIERGEVYFDVARDKRRPFIVSVGKQTVRAIGTAFNINRHRDRVVVTVTEGSVEVDSPGQDPQQTPVALKAGDQLTYGDNGDDRLISQVDLSQVTAWRERILQYQDEPLDYVIQDINRYASNRITLGSRSVSELSFTGTVLLDSIDSWLLGLEKAFPVRVLRAPAGDIVLLPPQGQD